jgi:putative nucleotidyltransferase with HDIG domain
LSAIDRNVSRLKIISSERIRDELQKILLSPEPSVGLWLLFNTGILRFVLPEMDTLYGVDVIEGQHHKNILTHTFKVIDGLRLKTDNLALLWSALLHDIGKAQTKRFDDAAGWTFYNHEFVGEKIAKRICRKFALSNELTEEILLYIRWHMQPVNLSMASSEITDSALRRLAVNVQDQLDNLFLLCGADITSKNETNVKTRTAKLEVIHKRVLEVLENDKLRAFQSPVRGEEIMDICGLPEGRAVGMIKKAIEEAILDGVIPNEYDAAKEYLLKMKDELLNSNPNTTN